MAIFDEDFIRFFKQLEKNNNKAWFDENRKLYEKKVRLPFKEFVTKMIQRLTPIQPNIEPNPDKAIFRINNDIRFAKDKPPYKTHMGANLTPGGRKSMETPGFYFQLSHENIMLAGGSYSPSTEGTYKIREYIANNPERFRKIINNKDFKNKFGEVKGEKHKRIPAEFKDAAEKEPLLANKEFYYSAFLPADDIISDKLEAKLIDYFKAGEPLNKFLAEALAGK